MQQALAPLGPRARAPLARRAPQRAPRVESPSTPSVFTPPAPISHAPVKPCTTSFVVLSTHTAGPVLIARRMARPACMVAGDGGGDWGVHVRCRDRGCSLLSQKHERPRCSRDSQSHPHGFTHPGPPRHAQRGPQPRGHGYQSIDGACVWLAAWQKGAPRAGSLAGLSASRSVIAYTDVASCGCDCRRLRAWLRRRAAGVVARLRGVPAPSAPRLPASPPPHRRRTRATPPPPSPEGSAVSSPPARIARR